jgi:radical SAM superfamily enzyme YgiQ (UPF0313 family)
MLQNILFSSVVGPHGVDGPHSRYKNPISLLGNQVTRGQEHYTVQMFSRTFAYDLFGANLNANVAVLDFPSEAQLRAKLTERRWDRVGLSGIMANFEKVLVTWRIVRETLPGVPIDIGGHIVNDDDVTLEMIERMREVSTGETFNVWSPSFERAPSSGLSTWIEEQRCAGPAVTFVKRDGLEFYARMPGVGLKREDVLYAPLVTAAFDKRALGIKLPELSSGLIIPDVGCPMRCDFCTTSAKFGGKFVKFLASAEDILAVADGHAARGITEMFVMSENFSLDTRRALALLKLMEEQRKPYSYAVFSSADALTRLGVENIVKLGYSFIWIGLEESTGSAYHKMEGVRLRSLIADLQAHGVEVLGSTILGFPHQSAADIDHEIEHALSYGCTYNQFMLYMAMPGTPLWKQMKAEQRLKERFPWCDIHGQHTQNWHHPKVPDQVMSEKLDGAFARDFEVLGPSILRIIETHFRGYCNTASWDHELVQMRRAMTRKKLPFYAMLLQAMMRDLESMGNATHVKARLLRDEIMAECGWKTKLACFVSRPYVAYRLKAARREYERSVRLKMAPEPSCLVTHYGHFDKRRSSEAPAPVPSPGIVAVGRPRQERDERIPLSARGGDTALPRVHLTGSVLNSDPSPSNLQSSDLFEAQLGDGADHEPLRRGSDGYNGGLA